MFMCVKVCLCVCVWALRMWGLCKPLPADNLGIVCVCLCISISYTYYTYSQGLVYEVEGDGHLSPAGRIEESYHWPHSAFLLPSSLPLTTSFPLWGFNTQTQKDLLHIGTAVGLLALKQSEAKVIFHFGGTFYSLCYNTGVSRNWWAQW